MKRVSIRLLFVVTVLGMGACSKQQLINAGEGWRDSICREETRDRGPCPEDEDESRWRKL